MSEEQENETRAKDWTWSNWDSDSWTYVHPRYSDYNSSILRDPRAETLEPFIEEEKRLYALALDGKLGMEMTEIAEEDGLRGILTRATITAAGKRVEDLIVEGRSYTRPTDDLEGLWELTEDFDNPNSDGRVKNDWRSAKTWKKGKRFTLRRNRMALDIILSMFEEEGEITPDLKKRAEREAGYVISEARAEHRNLHTVKLVEMPNGFAKKLRHVNLYHAKDAFDLVSPSAYTVEEVLEYIVDKNKGNISAGKLAHLLEQCTYAEGPFGEDGSK